MNTLPPLPRGGGGRVLDGKDTHFWRHGASFCEKKYFCSSGGRRGGTARPSCPPSLTTPQPRPKRGLREAKPIAFCLLTISQLQSADFTPLFQK